MKIGILSFHRAINYGAVLQCYALYKKIEALGHDVEIIDYRPASIEKYRKLFHKHDYVLQKGFLQKIRYILSSLLLVPTKKRTAKKFDSFLNREMKFSKVVNSQYDIPSYYDLILFGSDQIWNPKICEGVDAVYWGQFEHGGARLATYAASMGRSDTLDSDSICKIGKYIHSYEKISVREKDLKAFLKNEFSINSFVVCDPTLLLEKGVYERMLIAPKAMNYLVYYTVQNDEKGEWFATKIAEQINCPVIRLYAYLSPLRRKQGVRYDSELSPLDFLGYIANAKCIITNSFHMTAFSVIFRKNFYCLSQKSNSRVLTLLNSLELQNRLVNSISKVKYLSVDYSQVDEKLDSYKRLSSVFLTEVLEETCKTDLRK